MASFGSAAGAAETLSSVWALILIYAVLFGCKDKVRIKTQSAPIEVAEYADADMEMVGPR
jgi:hypothetical protein